MQSKIIEKNGIKILLCPSCQTLLSRSILRELQYIHEYSAKVVQIRCYKCNRIFLVLKSDFEEVQDFGK